MKSKDIREIKTTCITCWKKIKVTFDPPVKKIDCLEVRCCRPESKKRQVVK